MVKVSGMKTFKVLGTEDRKYLKNVPYDFILQYEDNAVYNHGQTVERLNQRGGLALDEMYCVINGLTTRESKEILLSLPELAAYIEIKVAIWKTKTPNL